MRSFLAGLILLVFASGAQGQATGFVSALGFQGNYRPDCWTPLLVHLDSSVSTAEEYQIQVRQQDLDKDTVVYTRTVTLGPQARQDYWAYFIPQPTGGHGVPGGSLPASPGEVAQVLNVYLYDKKGKYEVARLPAMVNANNFDDTSSQMGRAKGRRMILCVVERDKPSISAYSGALGVNEQVDFVTVSTHDLPESVLGYAAVDGIIWFDANAQDISTGGSKGFDAVQDYVRRGGQLIVCQPPEQFGKIGPFAAAGMLPVVAKDAKGEWAIENRQRPDLAPLMDVANVRADENLKRRFLTLEKAKGPWDTARARATPDAYVDHFIDWNDKDPGTDTTPYIARKAFGMGSVTWVAQDLGSPTLNSLSYTALRERVSAANWARVWDTVFGWKSNVVPADEYDPNLKSGAEQLARWPEGNPIDLGEKLTRGLDHPGKATAYIFLAVIFFIGYWVIAGPGSYLFLAARKRPGMSWAAFGLAALVAAGLTMLLVRLVLHGPAEARHLSIVRLSPAEAAPDGSTRFNALVRSRIGLYIPRDGEQAVTVSNTTAGQLATLTPYPIHPHYLGDDTGFTDRATYFVNTDSFDAGQPVTVDFPYRRTLKKVEAGWTGAVPNGIDGTIKMLPETKVPRPNDPTRFNTLDPRPSGKLLNKTGHDLVGVYFAFIIIAEEGARETILYVPSWPNGASIDLEQDYLHADMVPLSDSGGLSDSRSTKGPILFWGKYWYRGLSGSSLADPTASFEDRNFARSLPMMAFFNRFEPQPAASHNGEYASRVELLRRGGRQLDVSQLVAAGQCVIVAHTAETAALPLALDVDGDKVQGEGTILYEIALPVDRSAANAPATRPTTKPTTTPSTKMSSDK